MLTLLLIKAVGVGLSHRTSMHGTGDPQMRPTRKGSNETARSLGAALVSVSFHLVLRKGKGPNVFGLGSK